MFLFSNLKSTLPFPEYPKYPGSQPVALTS